MNKLSKPIEQQIVGENLVLTLGQSPIKDVDLFRLILDNEEYYFDPKSLTMDLDKESLIGMADFIYEYFENK
jgi:hypothetical protein